MRLRFPLGRLKKGDVGAGEEEQGGASKPLGVITGLDNIPWEFQGLSEGWQGVFPWGWGSSLPPVLGQSRAQELGPPGAGRTCQGWQTELQKYHPLKTVFVL